MKFKSPGRKTAFGALLLLAILWGAACVLIPSLVQDSARRYLAGLPSAFAAEGIALENPEVKEVRFSLFSRELSFSQLRLQGKIAAEPPTASSGSFLATTDHLLVRLSFKGLLLATPLASYILPDVRPGAELFPLFTSLEAEETSIAMAGQSLALNLSFSKAQAHDIAVDSALVRLLLDDSRHKPEALDWLYGFAATDLSFSGINLSLDEPGTNESLFASCSEFIFRELSRHKLAMQEARDLSCSLPNGRCLTIALWRQEAIALPKKTHLARLIRQLNLPEPSEKRFAKALKTAISGSEPLLGKVIIAGLVLPLNNRRGESTLQLERAVLDWRSLKPLNQQLLISGLSLPATLMEHELGFAMPGLPSLTLDATLSVLPTGTGPLAPEQHRGSLTARNLCSFSYDFILDSPGRETGLCFLRGIFSAAKLVYKDDGLLPRLAFGLIPVPEAAALALKIGLNHLCSAPTSDNAALRTAFDTFIERPGSLVLTARKPFKLDEALTLAGEGNLGSLISASATAGPETLGQAMLRIGREKR